MKVSIIGQGYVGLSLAVSAAKAGHEIVGFDVNSDLVMTLNSGISHVEGVEIAGLTGYQATDDASLIDGSDVVVIAVPTPLDAERKPDLSYLIATCKTIGENLTKKALIINESTSFPGTLRDLISKQIEETSGLGHLYAARNAAITLLVINAAQVAVGIWQSRTGLPPLLVGTHMLLACLVAAATTTVLYRLRKAL